MIDSELDKSAEQVEENNLPLFYQKPLSTNNLTKYRTKNNPGINIVEI